MTPLQLLTAAFEENRVHVSRDPHERPFRIQPKLCGSTQVWRVVMGGTGTGLGLTVTCALEEIENDQIPYWMARVYVARRDGAVIPSPCVPTTTHCRSTVRTSAATSGPSRAWTTTPRRRVSRRFGPTTRDG